MRNGIKLSAFMPIFIWLKLDETNYFGGICMTWLTDNIMSIVLLLVLAAIVFFILRNKIKAKGSGGCGCGCSGCSGCSSCGTNSKKQTKSVK